MFTVIEALCLQWGSYHLTTVGKFQTLVQLQQWVDTMQGAGKPHPLPKWFRSEYLMSPRVVHLEAWLVEAMIGLDREHIPYMECATQPDSCEPVASQRQGWDLDLWVACVSTGHIQDDQKPDLPFPPALSAKIWEDTAQEVSYLAVSEGWRASCWGRGPWGREPLVSDRGPCGWDPEVSQGCLGPGYNILKVFLIQEWKPGRASSGSLWRVLSVLLLPWKPGEGYVSCLCFRPVLNVCKYIFTKF